MKFARSTPIFLMKIISRYENKQSFAFYHINFTVHNTNKPKFYQLKTLFKPNFTLINAV